MMVQHMRLRVDAGRGQLRREYAAIDCESDLYRFRLRTELRVVTQRATGRQR